MPDKITLTVDEVALRQLESAIWMYAYDFDEAAVHTIAAASYELLARRLGFGDFEKQFTKKINKTERNEFWSKFNEPYNFFKHGSSRYKPMKSLTYSTGSVELVLMAACYTNTHMPRNNQLTCAHAFMSYQMVKWPNFFEDTEYRKKVTELRKKAEESKIDVHNRKLLMLALDSINKPFIE